MRGLGPAAHDHDVTAFGALEWLLVGVAALAAAWVIWRAVVLTTRPGEDDPAHIKHSILEDDAPPAGPAGGEAPPTPGDDRGPGS